ncbi:MAG: WG repeat-containing protein [Candidatus Cyclobacteriaceae bacterium M3_2C_046]
MWVKKIVWLFVLILFSVSILSANPKRALKLYQKGKFDKTEKTLEKSLAKDSLNPGAYYVYALLYLDTAYIHYSVDSSLNNIEKAIRQYDLIDQKTKDKLAKATIDHEAINLQKSRVDSAAFRVAVSLNTIPAYNLFLQKHPTAIQTDQAIESRNELAWQKARETYTYEAFLDFIQVYPEAKQVKQAEELYNSLLFKDKTADQSLSSFENFLQQYPRTPFREQAEKNILELKTFSNQVDQYLYFIKNYPNSVHKDKAVSYLYHTFKTHNNPDDFFQTYQLPIQDSLAQVIQLESGFLVPVLEENKFGFRDEQWNQLFPAEFDDIESDYNCGNIDQDYLVVSQNDTKSIIAKSGPVIYQGDFDHSADLGFGLIRLEKNGYSGLIHKTGERLLDFAFDDIKMLDGQFIKTRKNDKWGLYTLMGRMIFPEAYDEIDLLGPFMLARLNQDYAVFKPESLLQVLEDKRPSMDFIYEEVELLDNAYLIGYRGDAETLLNSDLNTVIPLERHIIYNMNDGWLIKRHNRYQVLNQQFLPITDTSFAEVQYNDNWLALKKTGKWSFITSNATVMSGFVYDSVEVLNNHFAYLENNDQRLLYFSNDSIVDLEKANNVKLLKPVSVSAGDQFQELLLVEEANRHKKIYNRLGQLMLEGRYDQVSALGNEYLVLDYRGRKGLADIQGNTLLKTIYDGIGNYKDGYVSLLRNQKFGVFHLRHNIEISPQYDQVIKPYNDSLLIVYKKGKAGLVDHKNKSLTDFDFDQITYWNDTSALVMQEDVWHILNLNQGHFEYEDISNYTYIRNDTTEVLIYILKEDKFGVLSNTRGEIIGPTFNDIVNLGTAKHPIYFAEKQIREAEFFVVIYYDHQGEILKREAFTGAEYDRIYCQY